MPDQPPTPLEAALVQACDFAVAHGVDGPIVPADFGIQRSAAGHTTATYVDSSCVVTVDIDRGGAVTLGVAELSWLHFPDPESDGDEDCGVCHPAHWEPTHFRGVPLETVHLPGDAPKDPAHV